ncbi:unnamed protein product [Tuber aestivum]|uniref:Uncharacterized protein n=1 Tax=Tuber aestivum TaxID=59557 RepID=A0A292PPT3_9PEZI|nr:unnamed protein product [Tuber aestivum]
MSCAQIWCSCRPTPGGTVLSCVLRFIYRKVMPGISKERNTCTNPRDLGNCFLNIAMVAWYYRNAGPVGDKVALTSPLIGWFRDSIYNILFQRIKLQPLWSDAWFVYLELCF